MHTEEHIYVYRTVVDIHTFAAIFTTINISHLQSVHAFCCNLEAVKMIAFLYLLYIQMPLSCRIVVLSPIAYRVSPQQRSNWSSAAA